MKNLVVRVSLAVLFLLIMLSVMWLFNTITMID